jgi:hypothetical protein
MKLSYIITAIIGILFFKCHFYSQVITSIPSITARMNYTAVSETNNVALIGGLEHYISTNQGNTWTELNNNSGSGLYQMEGFNLAVQSPTTFCMVAKGTMSGIYYVLRTTDAGTTWTIVINTGNSLPLKDIEVHSNTFIVTGPNGVYRSTDAGATWNFITLSQTNEVSNFVEYNNSASYWLIGGYNANMQISTDDGLTWTNLNLGFSPSAIQATTPTSNGIMITKSNATETQMVFLGTSNIADTVITISSGLIYQESPCLNACYLPNNKLFTFNQYLFIIADTISQQIYNIDSPPISGIFLIKKFSMESTYGVAIATNSGNTQSKAYLINFNGTSTLSVPSQFRINGPGPCAGDNIFAVANANYADSYQWFVNNVLVSTTNNLSYPTPTNTFTTYTIKLNTFYQGVLNSTTKSVVMTAPSPPGTFVATVDTSACYGLPLHIIVNPDGSPTNTGIKILYNGDLVYGPSTLTGVNVNVNTAPLTVSGTLQIITFKTLECDPSADTLTKQITLGPNLFNFTLQPHDSVICVGVNPELNFDGTNSQYNYDFSTTYSFVSAAPNHINVSGNSNGTLTVNPWGTGINENNNTSSESYGPMYMYIHLNVSDASGCSPEKIIDTIRVQRSTAYFELHSRSFLKNDTVHLSNAFITPNRLWSSDKLSSQFISYTSDTIPLIIADTLGFFDISLLNEPLPQCVDSTTEYIHYANQAPEFEIACDIKKPHEKDRLHKVSIDQFGNIYEIRAYEIPTYHYPRYILRKNDAYGNLIWEKRAQNYSSYGGVTGIAMEEIDFDEVGNPVVGLWIHGGQNYQDDYINYSQTDVNLQGNVYLLKLDKNNGDLIWRADLDALAPQAELSTGVRVTDIVVDRDVVHASVYSHFNLDFFTLNLENGSLINTTPFDLGLWSNSQFILPGFLFPNGSLGNSSQSYWSPQIDVLSTGEVVAVGHYQTVTSPNYSQLNNYGAAMFVMKYHPDQGVYDVEKMAQTGMNALQGGSGYTGFNSIPRMFVDKNDNITVAGLWENSFWNATPMEFKVFDSILPMKSGSFVVNFDSDYHINWLTKGTNANVEDMIYSSSTGETFLAVTTKDNYSIGRGNSHLRIGKEKSYNFNYTQLPNWQYNWLDFPQEQGFLTKLNSIGEPLEMKFIDHTSNKYIRMAGNPCGDLAIYTESIISDQFTIDNQNFTGDSVLLILQYSNCVSSDCSYLNAMDTLEACGVNDIIEIQLQDYYNLNSVTYSLVSGNTELISNQTISVTNGNFSFSKPFNEGVFNIVFSSPNIDTITVILHSLDLNFGDLSIDTICLNATPIQLGINAMPSNGIYSGDGVDGMFFYPSVSGAGSHELIYSVTDSNGCFGSINQIITVISHSLDLNFGDLSIDTTCLNATPIQLGINAMPSNGIYSGDGVDGMFFYPSVSGAGSHELIYSATDSNGCLSSINQIITVNDCLSVEDIDKLVSQFYPNPFYGIVEVYHNTNSEKSILIVKDNTGRIVFKQDLQNNRSTISLKHLVSGNYIFEIMDNDKVICREKLVKI